MSSTMHPLAAEYLDRLRSAAAALPKDQRNELVADIEEHLRESIPPGASEAEVRTALDRLGDPGEIVAGEGGEPARATAVAVGAGGTLERLAQLLLLFGALFGTLLGWGVGAFIDSLHGPTAATMSELTITIGALLGWGAGVVLLWLSPVWSVGSKLIGTLVVPGGLLPAAVLPLVSVTSEVCTSSGTGAEVCSGGIDLLARLLLIALWVALVVLPIVVAVHLGRKAVRPPA